MAYVPYCAYCVVVFVVFVCVCVWRALWEGGEGIVLNFMLSTHSPGHTLHGVDSSQHDTRRVVLRLLVQRISHSIDFVFNAFVFLFSSSTVFISFSIRRLH